jgi:hypothetical protein
VTKPAPAAASDRICAVAFADGAMWRGDGGMKARAARPDSTYSLGTTLFPRNKFNKNSHTPFF